MIIGALAVIQEETFSDIEREEEVRSQTTSRPYAEGYISSPSSDSLSCSSKEERVEEISRLAIETLEGDDNALSFVEIDENGAFFSPLSGGEKGECTTPFLNAPTRKELQEEWQGFADLYQCSIEEFTSPAELFLEERERCLNALLEINGEFGEGAELAPMRDIRAAYVHLVLRRGRSYTI